MDLDYEKIKQTYMVKYVKQGVMIYLTLVTAFFLIVLAFVPWEPDTTLTEKIFGMTTTILNTTFMATVFHVEYWSRRRALEDMFAQKLKGDFQ